MHPCAIGSHTVSSVTVLWDVRNSKLHITRRKLKPIVNCAATQWGWACTSFVVGQGLWRNALKQRGIRPRSRLQGWIEYNLRLGHGRPGASSSEWGRIQSGKRNHYKLDRTPGSL